METYTDEQISFQLILHSGNARKEYYSIDTRI